MGGLTDLGAPTVELSGRTPLRLWVVRAEDLPDKGHFIPTRIPGIWVVVAPMEREADDGRDKIDITEHVEGRGANPTLTLTLTVS